MKTAGCNCDWCGGRISFGECSQRVLSDKEPPTPPPAPPKVLTSNNLRERMVFALERIADALEAQNNLPF